MFHRLLKSIILLGLIALLGVALYEIPKINFDNSHWFNEDHPQEIYKDYLSQEFQKGENVIFISRLHQSFFHPASIESTKKISEKIEALEHIKELKTPLSATAAFSDKDSLSVITFQSALEQKILPDLASYKKKLVTSFYYKRLISEDFQKIAFVVKIDLQRDKSDFSRRLQVIENIKQLFAQEELLSDIAIVGEGQLNYQLDLKSQQNLKILIPLCFGIMLFLLMVIFRSWIHLFIVSFTAALCLLLTFNITLLQGHPLTVIGLSLPVLILVIATADSIHIVSRWNALSRQGTQPNQVLWQTVKQTWLPCLGTSITTSIGFGCFYFSEIIPLRHFGIDSFFSILASYFVIMLATTSLLYVFQGILWKKKKFTFYTVIFKTINILFSLSQKYKKTIVWLVFLSSAFFLVNLKNVFIETNFLDVFFPKKSPLYQDVLFADKYLSGTGVVDILFKAKKSKENTGESFKDFTNFETITTVVKKLDKIPNVNTVQSYLEPVSMIHQELSQGKNNLPKNGYELEQELLFLEFSRGDKKTDVISPHMLFDYEEGRIHIQTPNLNSTKINELKQEIKKILPVVKEISFTLAGSSIYFHALSEEVLLTQVLSILITLSITWFIFLILFGWKLGSLGLIPSIFPVLVTANTIIFLGIPFDFAVILIGSISFGLCVDDTIHLLAHYKKASFSRIGSVKSQLQHSVQLLSHPLTFTSILFCIGFAVFFSADLVILIKFGFFTFFTILLALFSTVVILPALVATFCKNEQPD